MKKNLLFIKLCLLLMACSATGNNIKPVIHQDEFQGFVFSETPVFSNMSLKDYEYDNIDGKVISITSCKQANDLALSQIPEFEYFRFNLLLLSCEAVNRFNSAAPSKASYFPTEFKADFFAQLPAAITPLLNYEDKAQRQSKTLKGYDKNTKYKMETPRTAKLLTAEDEIYITLLARGDFDADGNEDLLVKSEWFARNAFGKHADLLILRKPGENESIQIQWRFKPVK